MATNETFARAMYSEVRSVPQKNLSVSFVRFVCHVVAHNCLIFVSCVCEIQLSATQTMRNIPRFGKSSNFADIWQSKEAQSNYMVGLLFAGIFLFSIFFTWTIILLIFKLLGRQKVGFLAGAPFIRPADPTIQYNNRPFLCRLVFLNASLLFIVFSVLFVTEGLTNLRTTVNTLADASNVSFDPMADPECVGGWLRVTP
jgi:hypothetical protein